MKPRGGGLFLATCVVAYVSAFLLGAFYPF